MGIKSAAKWYKDFREETPKRARTVRLKLPDAVAIMGTVDAISYRTTVGREARRYKHAFAKASRPLLCTDGRRIYLIGGRYHITERGIVDLTATGRERE